MDTVRTISSSVMTRITYAVMVFSIGFFAVRLIPYLRRPTGGFLAAYSAGRMVSTHQDMRILYNREQFPVMIEALTGVPPLDVYTGNTPVLPFLLLPFAGLPIADAKLAWSIFSLVCLVISLFLIFRHFDLNPLERAAVAAFVFGFNPLYVNFVWGQVYSVLFLLHVLIVRLWVRGNLVAASVPIALLLALKGYGVLFLILAFFRKEWLLVLYACAGLALIVALSSIAIGPDVWIAYASQIPTLLSAMPASATYQQTVGSLFGWLLAPDRANPHPGFDIPSAVLPLVGILLLAGIFLLYLFTRQSGRTATDLSIGAAIIIGVLTAPRLFDYHYTFVLIPILASYKYSSVFRSRTEIAAYGFALFLLSVKFPYFESVFQNTWLGLAGFPRVYGAVILLGLLCLQSRRKAAEPHPVTGMAGP